MSQETPLSVFLLSYGIETMQMRYTGPGVVELVMTVEEHFNVCLPDS